jgi:hypothetical protein
VRDVSRDGACAGKRFNALLERGLVAVPRKQVGVTHNPEP